jgi:hypothetical protein
MADEQDYYRCFCNAVLGLIDDAEMSGYAADGIEHLREASEYFESDWRTLKHAREQEVERKARE